MSKKPDIGAPEDPLDSSESQEEDSFVFELFDYDEEDSEDEVEFAVGTETPDVAPQPVAPPEGGVYSKSSGDAPSMVEDLAPAPSDAAAPRQDASLSPDVDNGVLGRINLRTVSPQEMRRRQNHQF